MSQIAQSTSTSIAKKGLFSYGTSFFLVVFRFAKTVIIARILNPELRGVFAIITIFSELVCSLSSLGIGGSLTYFIGKSRKDFSKILGSAMIFFIGATIISCFIGYGLMSVSTFFKSSYTYIQEYKYLILFIIPLLLFKNIYSEMLIGLNEIYKVNILRILNSATPLIFLIFFISISMSGLNSAIYAWVVAIIFTIIISIYFLKPYQIFKPNFSFIAFTKHFKFGLSLYPITIFQLIVLRSDQLFISAYHNSEDLGYYSIATNCAELILILPESLALPLIPYLLGKQYSATNSTSEFSSRFVIIFMLIVSGVTFLFGNFTIETIFGDVYKNAALPFLLLQPGIIGYGIFTILKLECYKRGHTGLISILVGFSSFINIIGNFLLIPKYSYNGAAISSSLTYISIAIALSYVLKIKYMFNLSNLLIPKLSDFYILKKLINTILTHKKVL